MEITSSTISDLWPFISLRDLLSGGNGDVGRLNFSKYGHSDLPSLCRFLLFLMVVARKIILAIFVLLRSR